VVGCSGVGRPRIGARLFYLCLATSGVPRAHPRAQNAGRAAALKEREIESLLSRAASGGGVFFGVWCGGETSQSDRGGFS